MKAHNQPDIRSKQREALLADISAAKSNIDIAHQNFNRVCDPDEVDVYIYRLRTAEARYGSLIKKLKEVYK